MARPGELGSRSLPKFTEPRSALELLCTMIIGTSITCLSCFVEFCRILSQSEWCSSKRFACFARCRHFDWTCPSLTFFYQSTEIKSAAGELRRKRRRRRRETFLSPSPPQLLRYSPAALFTFRVFMSVD